MLENCLGRSISTIKRDFSDNDQLVAQIDEEFGDVDELVDDQKLVRPSVDEDPITVAPPADHQSEEEEVEYTHV